MHTYTRRQRMSNSRGCHLCTSVSRERCEKSGEYRTVFARRSLVEAALGRTDTLAANTAAFVVA